MTTILYFYFLSVICQTHFNVPDLSMLTVLHFAHSFPWVKFVCVFLSSFSFQVYISHSSLHDDCTNIVPKYSFVLLDHYLFYRTVLSRLYLTCSTWTAFSPFIRFISVMSGLCWADIMQDIVVIVKDSHSIHWKCNISKCANSTDTSKLSSELPKSRWNLGMCVAFQFRTLRLVFCYMKPND